MGSKLLKFQAADGRAARAGGDERAARRYRRAVPGRVRLGQGTTLTIRIPIIRQRMKKKSAAKARFGS